MALIFIAGYICRRDERTDGTLFHYEKHGIFLKSIDCGGVKIQGDMVFQ